jgi:hypothetical protein
MRCENARTFSKPGKCPSCHMRLADTRAHMDHRPKHGGTFFMTSDNLHHLEGVLTDDREFRVYFYDEFTKPIAAGGFAARVEVGGTGAKDAPAVALAPARTHEFLLTRLDSAANFPVQIKLFVDFRDGAGPQRFDFEFTDARP